MKKQVFVSALTAMLFSLTITALLTGTITPVFAQAPSPKLKFEPNFHFGEELGEEFDFNVTIYDVDSSLHLIGIHFRLSYDPTLLEVINVSEGEFLPKFNQTPTPPPTLFVWATEPNGIFGPHIVVGDILLPNATGHWPGPYPEGNGTVATITFRVIYQPVEPDLVKACLLRFIEVILLDDQGREIDYEARIFYYQTPEPMLYPEPSFTYRPEYPMAGQVILFNATESKDPDGKIVEYVWDFDDGTVLSTGENETVVTHIYAQPKTYNVTLSLIDDDGLISGISTLIEVGVYAPIEIKIETGKVYYLGEITEFYVLTSQLGRALNVTFTKLLLYFNGTPYADFSNLTRAIGDGFYQISYTIPGEAKTGVYTLLVEVEFSNITNRNIASFQISDTLTTMSDTIIEINGDVGQILTEIGKLQFNLTEINAKLVDIEGNIGIINSTLGTLKIDIENIDGKILDINGTVATISTTLGDVNVKLGDVQSIATTTLYATSALSAIAVILAAAILILLRKR